MHRRGLARWSEWKIRRSSWCLVTAMCMMGWNGHAVAQLHWRTAKKEPMKLRLVALAWNHPRGSAFANEEVFIAEKELDPGEWRLVKLVYEFLPYQPRLSDYGLDHETVHELHAVRDESCDEPLRQLMSGETGDWKGDRSHVQWSTEAPAVNPERQRAPLPCYETSADDYDKAMQKPE